MYDEYTFENDIALVKIKDMIPTNSKYIATIKLKTLEIPINTVCTYSGFGYTTNVCIFLYVFLYNSNI